MSSNYMGVDKPLFRRDGCWVLVHPHIRQLMPEGNPCGCRARPGFLTCRYHVKYEEPAQEWKAHLDKGGDRYPEPVTMQDLMLKKEKT